MKNIIDVKRGYGRTIYQMAEDSGKVERVEDFQPYMYSVKKLPKGVPVERVTKKVLWSGKDVETWKINYNTPLDVTRAKNLAKAPVFEFDVNFLMRYAMDKIRSKPTSGKALVYDIETDMKRNNAFESAAYEVIQISKEGFVTRGETVAVHTAEEMIDTILKHRCIIGHNAQWFDNRIMEKYHPGLTIPQFIPHPIVNERTGHCIRHAMNIDTLQLASRAVTNTSYGLKTLAQNLGLGKVIYIPANKIAKVSQKERDEYCMNDVMLTAELAKKLLPFLWTVWKMLEIPPGVYMQFGGRGSLDLARMMFAREFPEYYIPAKEKNTKSEIEHANPQAYKHMKYQIIGGKTFKPQDVGSTNKFYEDVWMIDFRSAYQNTIIKRNIGPELVESTTPTALRGILINKEDKKPKVVYLKPSKAPTIQKQMIEKVIKVSQVYRELAKTDPKYSTIYKGIKGSFGVNLTQGMLSVERKKDKRTKQYMPGPSAFLNLVAGSVVTTTVREEVTKLADAVEKDGWGKVIYGDTDGIYYVPLKATGQKIFERAQQATDLEIDAEHISVAYFVAGKTYAMIHDEKGMMLKGAVLRGRDKTRVCIGIAKEIIGDMLKTQVVDKPAIIKQIDERLQAALDEARKDDSKLFDFAIHVRMREDYKSPHLRNITKFYQERYGKVGSFDGVVTGTEDVTARKPQATIAFHHCVESIDDIKPDDINIKWYQITARYIIESFLDINSLEEKNE